MKQETKEKINIAKLALIDEITVLANEVIKKNIEPDFKNTIALNWDFYDDITMRDYPYLLVDNEKPMLIYINADQDCYDYSDEINAYKRGDLQFETEEICTFSIDELCNVLKQLERI